MITTLTNLLRTGNDISNIDIVLSEIPFISGITGESDFLISAFDPTGSRVRTTLQVQLSKCVWKIKVASKYQQDIQAMLTVTIDNCSSRTAGRV